MHMLTMVILRVSCVVLQVLAELKRVLKEDAGLELNISKSAILSKDIYYPAGAL